MITENQFDMVFDCQQIFKALMNALARPGHIETMAPQIEKLETDHAALLAAGLTLLDNWRSFYVCGDAPELAQELKEMTYGVPAEPEKADYVFLPRGYQNQKSIREMLESVKIGTLPEPHKSATLFIELDQLCGGPETTLTGPGINGAITVTLPEEGRQWLVERQAMAFEFPCGVELYFITPQGQIMGIPRKIKVGGTR